MQHMSRDSGDVTTFTPFVGAEVTVTDRTSGTVERGRIVDDYGDAVLSAQVSGRNWAPARRWAVALESGRLIFADTADFNPPAQPGGAGFAGHPGGSENAGQSPAQPGESGQSARPG